MNIITEDGTVLTLQQIQQAILGMVSEEEAQLFGCPMPSLSDMKHELVIAKGIKTGPQYQSLGREAFEDTDETKYVNSWNVMGREVILFRDKKGPGVIQIPYGHYRLTNLIQSMVLRFGAITCEAEVKAMQRLATHVSDPQYTSYILSGAFIETSKRSAVKYVFRKNAPTLALRETKDYTGEESMRCLAALCLHPMAYYKGTSAGSMAPTDEVIAHLLMMRGDEHLYWRKSNQHRNWDPRSGV
jgi:hypothetical protein